MMNRIILIEYKRQQEELEREKKEKEEALKHALKKRKVTAHKMQIFLRQE